MRPLLSLPHDLKIDFMGKRWIWFIFSIFLTLATIGLIFTKGLNFGIDFSGGVLIEAGFKEEPDLAKLRVLLNDQRIGDVSLQHFGSKNNVLIRVGTKAEQEAERNKIIASVKQTLTRYAETGIEFRKEEYVGPKVGEELVRGSIIAVVLSFIAIMAYVWVRFEWQYGIGAILALLHDAILTFGFLSLMHIDFNLATVAAILTIVGYSINDSVVIYDRVRENLRKFKKMPMDELLNMSINHTLSRTILTASTTLLATVALIVFGGENLAGLSLTLFFGILVGTYSSIYVSAPVLIYLKLRREEAAA